MRDTDNDRIADDWERYRFGNLTTAGPGSVPCANPANGWYTDYNNDGVNDYDSYALTPMNVDPTDPNAALADGIPFIVKTALGLDPLSPLVFPIGAVGLDAARQSVVAWSAVAPEGSARIDAPGRAVIASGDVELGYQMQYSADLRDWTDLLSGGVIEYDAVNNEFRFVGAVGGSGAVYYRLRVFWSN